MKYFLFLDFDGTLASIAKKPRLAGLTPPRRLTLKKLSQNPHIRTAIISGRMLADLKRKVGIKGIYYSGNHGFEIEGPGIKLVHPEARRAKPFLKKIKAELTRHFGKIKGILIEDKGLSLSLHYRLVSRRNFRSIRRIFPSIIAPHKKSGRVIVTHGKKVIEVRPNVPWDKGKAVLWFMKKAAGSGKIVPIYIGDDVTDEDAFRVLEKNGLTIRVGRAGKSRAQRSVKNIDGVFRFLESLQRMC